MPKCLREKCPHYKEYEIYRFCRLINNEVKDDCIAMQKRKEAYEVWGSKISMYQAKISELEELEQRFS